MMLLSSLLCFFFSFSNASSSALHLPSILARLSLQVNGLLRHNLLNFSQEIGFHVLVSVVLKDIARQFNSCETLSMDEMAKVFKISLHGYIQLDHGNSDKAVYDSYLALSTKLGSEALFHNPF